MAHSISIGKWSFSVLLALASCTAYAQSSWNTPPAQLQSLPAGSAWPRVAQAPDASILHNQQNNTPGNYAPAGAPATNSPQYYNQGSPAVGYQSGWNTPPAQLQSLPARSVWPRVAQAPDASILHNQQNNAPGNYTPASAPATNTPQYYDPGSPAIGYQSNPGNYASGGCATGNCASGNYTSGAYASGSCAPSTYVPCRTPSPWYFSAAGLYLGRNEPRRVWTSYENNNNANQIMNTQDVDPDWQGGVDLRLGRYFACNRWRMELGFWSINNFSAYSSQTHANGVSSPLQFNDLEFAVGDPVADYFDSAMEHRLTRTNEMYNVELNIIEGNLTNTGCSPWSSRMLVGLRYFQFNEDLVFASLDQGGTWGGNGGLDEVYLSDSTRNDLIGAQVGCLFQRRIGARSQLFITPKFGVYNNHIQNRFDLRRGDGTAAMPSAFSNVNGSYPVESSTNTIAFLSEADLGLQYQVSQNWTIFGGYRVVALNNIGLADNQIPQYIVDIPEIADIDTNGSLILHGAFFGISRSL